ncbi:cytochrome b5-like heme/steroid binding domain-containing protein [Sporobolomyces koalae]|uniref:cytochrome b5-like heme/steroid binding domain-containing protein n=1 Tax=Sporobolomyces koalae TaxID=500713 RepID=UPI00317FEF1B
MADAAKDSSSTSDRLVDPAPAPGPAKSSRPIKKANQPFLVHQKYKQRQLREQQQREQDPRSVAAPTSFVVTALRWVLVAFITSTALSRAITQTWYWGCESRYTSLSNLRDMLLPPTLVTLSETELSRYDGTDPTTPVYLAIDGQVYDVSQGKESYGPGGAYHIFAGRDAARAFVTGCFKTHLTHDLRGFTEKDMATLRHWKDFYHNHAKYRLVGRVMHPPIDPGSPIPPPCTSNVKQPDSRSQTQTRAHSREQSAG